MTRERDTLKAENEGLSEEATRVSKLERELKVLKGKNAVLLKDVRALEVCRASLGLGVPDTPGSRCQLIFFLLLDFILPSQEEKVKLSEELATLTEERANEELQQYAESTARSNLQRTGSIVSSDGRPMVRHEAVCTEGDDMDVDGTSVLACSLTLLFYNSWRLRRTRQRQPPRR